MATGSLPYLRETLGFDLTERTGRYLRVACSQCASMVVNGTPIHERTCPNETFECRGCNARVQRAGAYCEDCQ